MGSALVSAYTRYLAAFFEPRPVSLFSVGFCKDTTEGRTKKVSYSRDASLLLPFFPNFQAPYLVMEEDNRTSIYFFA